MNKNLLRKISSNLGTKMKKEVTAFLFLFGFLIFNTASAQTVAYNYNYSESAGNAYTALAAGGTVVATGAFTNLATWTTIPLATDPMFAGTPFPFHYNGSVIQNVSISDNGFVILNDGTLNLPIIASTVNPTSNATAYKGAISAFGFSLYGQASSEVRCNVIGTAPNRVLVIQYQDVLRRIGLGTFGNVINMQIRLNETTNVIETIYRDAFTSGVTNVGLGQAGLRGASAADFNTRKSTTAAYPATSPAVTNLEGFTTSNTVGWLAGTKLVWTPCFAPTAITSTLQADNSTVVISWTNPSYVTPPGFDWEINTSGIPGTGVVFSGSTALSSVSVPGLNTGITYYIFVKPNCKTTWLPSTPASITPTCPNATIPYSQNFEGVITPAIPNCNSALVVSGALMVTQNNTSTPFYGFNSKNAITQGALAQNTWYFTQAISVTAGDIAAAGGSFRLGYTYGGSREQTFFEQKMRVYIGSAASVVGMTTLLADHNSIKLSPINGVINFAIAVPGVYYIGFNGYAAASNGYLQLDNITLDYSSCKPPTALTSGQVTSSSAIIAWTAPTPLPAGGYQFYVSTSSTAPIASTFPSGSTAAGVTLSPLTALAASTTYYFWVRSDCGGEVSIWSNSGTFTTPAPYVVTCTPSGFGFTQDPNGITNVTMGSINNTTGIEVNNYGDYSGLITNAAQGATLPVNVTFSTGFTYDTTVWVDWNNDGDFIDPGELESQGVSGAAIPSTVVVNITIAAGEPIGPRRVRIGGVDFGPLTDPCRTNTFQAFEDYSIYVISPPPPLTLSGSSNIICSGETTPAVTLTSNINNYQVYTWSPTSGVVPVSAGSWTFNPTTTTTYILTGTQNSGSFASNTASYTITVNPLPTPITITPSITTTCQNAAPGGVGATLVATGGIISGVTILNENFNGATNTFVAVNNSTTITTPSNPAAAAWTLRNSPYLYNGFTSFSSNDNSQFYLSNSDEQGSGGLTNTTLTSPSFSLAAPITNASLSFWHVYRGWSSGTARVEISIDGGGSYNPIPTLAWTTASTGLPATWVNVTYNLAPYVGNANCRIRFNYKDARFGWFWGIDNFKVTGSSTSDITWSPFAGLYTSPTLSPGSAYAGQALGTVYAAPTTTTTYYAGADSLDGCHTETPVTITVTPVAGGTASSNQVISCGATPAAISVTGNTGVVTGWQYSNNPAFTGPVNIPLSASSTLAGIDMLPITGTKYFRAVITTGSCAVAYSTIVTISLATSTWTGSWAPGPPTSGSAAVFASGAYVSTGDLNACSVTVNSGASVTFMPGHSLIVENTVNVIAGGTLTFEDDASLVQLNNVTNFPGVYSGGNTGYITYKRTTTSMNTFDYTYWSTPVNTQTLLGVSPLTLADKYYHFNTTTYLFQSLPPISLMNPGKGYIIRAPQGHVSGTYTASFGSPTSGVPNSGTLTTPIVYTNPIRNLNLLGNPYPSALNADLFLTDPLNAKLDATIYLWTHTTPVTAGQYAPSDYALYNFSGGIGTGTAVGAGPIPNGKIAAGQGFFIKALATTVPGDVATYKNSMRVIGNNAQFFRNGQANTSVSTIADLEKNRVWLEVFNETGLYKQILVGYIETATNDLDRGFDGEIVDAGNPLSLYSIHGTTKLGIQGRALPFDVNDIVPLGFKSTASGTYEIRLSNFDGFFANQNVYLEDTLLNVIHDLKQSNYSFATNIGTFENRFILRYTTTALNNNESTFNENSVVIYKDNQDIHINTSNVLIDNVQIYDVRGRELYNKKGINNSQFVISNLEASQQVILVKVTSVDGKTITKKIVF
jgi:hypothetical protein